MAQPNTVLVGFTLVIAYVIVTAIYRLYFHPLAKFPGPFWARLTGIPAWWHSRAQDRHLWLLKLQEQYGKTHSRRRNRVLGSGMLTLRML